MSPTKPFVVTCAQCSKPFATIRKQAKYCGDACRQRASIARRNGNVVTLDTPEPPAKLTYAQRFVDSVRNKLTAAGRENEPLSLLALSLAEDAVNERLPVAARKQFTAEFRATYAEAMRGVRVDSHADELRRRRDALRAGIA
jgi:hypothetical protein